MEIWVKISSDDKVIDKANSENQVKEKEMQNFLTNKEYFIEFVTEVYSGWELAEMIFEKNTEQIYTDFKHNLIEEIDYLGWQKIEIEN